LDATSYLASLVCGGESKAPVRRRTFLLGVLLDAPVLMAGYVATAEMAADRLKEVVMACRDDIVKLCAKILPGQGRVAQCLITNKAAVSQQCAGAIGKLETVAAK